MVNMVTHKQLNNGLQLNLLAPYLGTTTRADKSRVHTYLGFADRETAEKYFQLLHKYQPEFLRGSSQLLGKPWEVRVTGLTTQQIKKLHDLLGQEKQKETPGELITVAEQILPFLVEGTEISTKILSSLMTETFSGSDAEGKWLWKDAYESLEMAQVLYVLQRTSILTEPSKNVLEELQTIGRLCPTQTKRSEESVDLQQFSTPLPLAYLSAIAGGITAQDVVLEPSAGTGLLAAFAQVGGAKLILNEICKKRRGILKSLFPDIPLFDHNAEQINDYLKPEYAPNLILMNPPFSASVNMAKRNPWATFKHIKSALARLQEGGRLVAITANWFSPLNPQWANQYEEIDINYAQVLFSVGVEGNAYAKHGTTIDTRLTVFEKRENAEQAVIRGEVLCLEAVQELLASLPARNCPVAHSEVILPSTPVIEKPPVTVKTKSSKSKKGTTETPNFENIIFVNYRLLQNTETTQPLEQGLYEPYRSRSIVIEGAQGHPYPLVESQALSSVAQPKPSYKPLLPANLIHEGILSGVQLESIIYAGESHSQFIQGYYRVDETLDNISAASEYHGVQFRRGFFLADGTGTGKGRQVAGVILDNYLQGRKKALWISKSESLLEDARRDWIALGGYSEQIIPLSSFRQGEAIAIEEGIIFATYATLRTEAKENKKSRVQQLLDWCGNRFEGVIVFDESHCMGNAASEQGERGIKKASLQGSAGLKLQYGLPSARVLYVSATGATTINNLAYAQRLGLWLSREFPFPTQADFVAAIQKGGIAALEVVCRDLKALGLYRAVSLSYQGIEYDMLEHELTAAQIQIYDAYAEAFQIIHQNLQEALKENNVVDFEGKSRNKNTKAAAMSAFEGNKQRFFNHLLISMKCPTLLKAIAQDLENGHAVVVQIVSTDEALLDRRLAEIPPSEWSDLQIDVTPREYIMDYLMNSFPIHLHEVYTDEKGVEHSYSVTDSKGNPVICQESLRKRDELIENLGLLPPVQGSLDQIVQHFGYENVAEVTGRSKRIVRETKGGRDRLTVQKRPGSSNICETQAFMDDKKRILVFSEAGGTGRSYHSDRNVKNQRLRVHYLLEAGWKADSAIQGLGRTNRTNQVQAPLFRPVATNVKGEKRFLSTIARRLDSLGALTRGQRQTGGQGLFREEDNLESPYAKAALRQLFTAIYANKVPCCSLKQFQESTGLSLTDKEGYLKEELPPISQFLNRVLALPIQQQNDLFAEFETRLENKIEEAIAAGTYEVGVETLRAESLTILSTQRIYTHPQTQAQTQCVKIQRKQKTKILSLEDALSIYRSRGKLVLNERSGKVAVMVPTNSLQGENGEIISRVNLLRPASSEKVFLDSITESYWQETDQWTFTRIWQEEVAQIPECIVDSFYLITGLLLPIWDRLDAENMRVFRLQTDEGERLLGRLVEAENLAVVYENLGISETPVLSKEEILQAVFKRREVVPLIRSWQLAAKTVAGNQRLEILGVQNSEVSRLKALGCITEVISWQTRIFIPTNNALAIIEQILGDR